MSFDTPVLVMLSPLVALVFAGLAFWAFRARLSRAARWSIELAGAARRGSATGVLLIGLSVLAGTVALSGPRYGSQQVVSESKALNLVIAMDVSRSMLATDEQPSRLERAKAEAMRLVFDLASDRMGLIAFAGESFILSPLTTDAAALRLLIESLDTETTTSGGTDLTRVISQGRQLLEAEQGLSDRVLVVFTDGEMHDSLRLAVEQARQLRDAGVQLIIASQGRAAPVRIPVRNQSGEIVDYYRNIAGDYVLTARRDDLVSAVADAAQGMIVSAEVPNQAERVRELVADLKRSPQTSTSATQRISRAWIPALIAFIFLFVQTVTRRTAALAALALLLPTGRADAQVAVNRADRAWEEGQVARAAQLYLDQVQRGAGGDTAWYNAGTAALAAGDSGLARRALIRASESLDPDIRFRALYNLGLLQLQMAENFPASEREFLDEARRIYRTALLLRPDDEDARWNYELSLRPPPPPDDGGDQGENQEDPQEDPQSGEQQQAPAQSSLSMSQAEQILNSIAEEERATRDRMNNRRRNLREILRDKDW